MTGTTKVGFLVPASNTNAEPLTAAVLRDVPGIEVFASRFTLPPSLATTIDLDVLGPAFDLLDQAAPDVVAFHGTAGSWTGIDRDAALADTLARAGSARVATTATQAMLAALDHLGARTVSVAFPGTAAIVDQLAAQYRGRGLEVVAGSTLPTDLSNPQIAALPGEDVAALLRAAAARPADVVLCVGTNLRSGPWVEQIENECGVVVVDSALALVWHVLRLAGSSAAPVGWGTLLRGG